MVAIYNSTIINMETLKNHAIIQSMSRKGNCLDNSVMENFFGLLKSELLYLEKFDSYEDFLSKLKDYIDYYNTKRLKIADGADILLAPSAYKINTNAIRDYEMPLAIIYLFKSIIIESI